MKGWFYQDGSSKLHYIQDDIHILTKMKSRLLTPSSLLPPLGQFVVSPALIKIINKRDLGLVLSDLQHKDKMKFKVIEKMTNQRVLYSLASIPGSDGTRFYLAIGTNIFDSFTSTTTESLRRIYLAWKSVFKMGLWREWLENQKYYSL